MWVFEQENFVAIITPMLKTNISTSLFYLWKHLETITLSHPQGMLELLQTGELADVDVMVGGRVFRCHKAILGARSPVLKAAFVHNMMEKATGKINIDGIESNTVRSLSRTETPISTEKFGTISKFLLFE